MATSMKKPAGIIIIALIAISCKSEQSNIQSDHKSANIKGHV